MKISRIFYYTMDIILMKGKIKNLFALGCFTKSSTNHIAYMVGVVDATAHYLYKYEDLPNNIFA